MKVLKDEIRKPYFLDLKRFLWKEGVQWPEIPKNLNVFPPRESFGRVHTTGIWIPFSSTQHLRVVKHTVG